MNKRILLLHPTIWRKLREVRLCEYTDEEFNKALNGDGIIKTGKVYGCGEVIMGIDRPFPTLENAASRALQMEYQEKLIEVKNGKHR